MKKLTRVQRYIRKGKPVKEHKRTVYTITPIDRTVFNQLAQTPYEVGGQLDFKSGKLKTALVHIGNETTTDWEYDSKYGMSYHTHPNLEGSSILPSYDDIISMRTGKEKAQVIFLGKYALSIVEKEKFDKVNKEQIKKVSDMLQKDYEKGYSDFALYTKFKPILLDKLGLDIKLHQPKQDIKLKVKL